MKNINVKFFLLAVFISLAGCATFTDDILYRPKTFANETLCGTANEPIKVDLNINHDKKKNEFLESSPLSSRLCSIQAYNRDTSVAYDMAFIEMLDSGDTKGTEAQIGALNKYIEEQLKKDEELWVYVFVHGWRHNAEIGDRDIAKFHTMLALSKNHLNQKNLKTKVLGVYVGWRGKLIKEDAPGRQDPDIKNLSVSDAWFVPVALSFPGRKLQSDTHSARLRVFLEKLEKQLKINPPKTTKLITIGHSLGGNMLLRAVTPMLKDKINPTGTPAGTVVKGFGDLVVLLNPASELINWQELQNASREHAGIAATAKNSYLNASECQQLSVNITEEEKQKCLLHGTHHVYPAGQLPVVVSFTSAKHFDTLSYSKKENEIIAAGGKIDRGDTDAATSTFFPLAQRAMNWFGTDKDIKALGQVLPKRAWNNEGKPDQEAYGNLMYGLSHEMEIDDDAGIATTYQNALKPGVINCNADRAMLTREIENYINLSEYPPKAKEGETQKSSISGGRGWDHGKLIVGNTKSSTDTNKTKSIEINVKHGVLRTKCSARRKAEIAGCDIGNSHQVPRLGHAREPYWNIAAHQNLIDGHGAYVSAALSCFVNGLVIP